MKKATYRGVLAHWLNMKKFLKNLFYKNKLLRNKNIYLISFAFVYFAFSNVANCMLSCNFLGYLEVVEKFKIVVGGSNHLP